MSSHDPDQRNPEPQDETRQRLVHAAEEVFAEKGFDAATVRDICERAGVRNIGAINYHFQGKEKLYAEAVNYAMDTCVRGMPFPEWADGTPPDRKLRDFIRVMMARILEVPRSSAMQLMTREMTRMEPSPVSSAAVTANIKPMAELLHRILAELLPTCPLQKRLLIGFSVVGQCLYYRQNRIVGEILFGRDAVSQMDVDVLARHIADFSLSAVTPWLTESEEPQ